MKERYDIDVEQDTLKGRLGMVVVGFGKYFIKHDIDINKTDDNDPIMIKFREAIRLERYIYSYKTYEELDKVEQRLYELRSFLNGLQ